MLHGGPAAVAFSNIKQPGPIAGRPDQLPFGPCQKAQQISLIDLILDDLLVCFFLDQDPFFQACRPKQLPPAFHHACIFDEFGTGDFVAVDGHGQQPKRVFALRSTLFCRSFGDLAVDTPVTAVVLFCEVVRCLAPAFYVNGVLVESSHLVNIFEIEQTGPSTAVPPSFEDSGFHRFGVDFGIHEPQFVGVRVPPMLAEGQFE